ncbi:MAG: dienelactone hydrolase family protein, partial [Cyanobacteria bacterium REEB65]|nr:dienelactone hydrolase family protein [Cyanobacteria bacterium REEB65]
LGMEVSISPETFMAAFRALQTLPAEDRAVPDKVAKALEVLPQADRGPVQKLIGIVFKGPTPEGLEAVQSAVDLLKAEGAPKVGITGFCLGGGYTWAFAFSGGKAEAFAPFYGRLPQEVDGSKVCAALEGHFGAEDHGIPVAPLEEAAAAIRKAGGEAEIFVYEGAGHAFFNETRDTYHPSSASLAWKRLLAFFGRNLSLVPAAR